MNRITSFSVALLLILSGILGLSFIHSHQKMGKPGVKLVQVPLYGDNGLKVLDQSVALPEKVLNFTSFPGLISTNELNILPKDTIFGRRGYTNANFSFSTSVVLMGKDRTSIHQPQFCLVGQGWNIEKSEIVSLRINNPHPYYLPVMKLTASQIQKDGSGKPIGRRSALYLYWFVAEDNLTAQHGQRMWSMLKVLLQKGVLERWAYVSYFAECIPGREDAAFDQLSEIIRDSVPQFQLTTGPRIPEAGKDFSSRN